MATALVTPEQRYQSVVDPCKFSRTWLKRRLWQKQQEIAESVQKNLLTAVKGCHASGKTYEAAGLPLWWLVRHKHGKVFQTSPTLRQVKTFWKEVRLAHASPVSQLLPEPSTTGLEVSEDRYALGASSSAGVNIQGFHGQDVLIIADEAPGIDADIWDSIEGIRAGGRVRVLELGNPVIPSGHFFDSFARGRGIYNCISISAFDTPNLQHEGTGQPLSFEELMEMPDDRLDYSPYPFLITRRWVKERYLVWGPNHPKFRSRVLAEFPNDSPYQVFPLSWIERAKRDPTEKEMLAIRGKQIRVGIDVAGPGRDETCLTARVCGVIIRQEFWHDPDPRGAVARVLGELMHDRLYAGIDMVVIDVVGMGYYFALHMAGMGFPVFGFNEGARAMAPDQYVNQKAEAHFAARQWFQHNLVCGLNDEETEAQLSTIMWTETPRGLSQIESKEQRNKRGIPGSPDRAESVVMAFMRMVPQQQTVADPDLGPVVISPY